MLDFTRVRKAKMNAHGEEKRKEAAPSSALTSRNAIKRLSLSFYGQETIRSHKKVIIDDVDLTTELPFLPSSEKQKGCKRGKSGRKSKRPSGAK